LVNLTCGRNPWKRACYDDSTFRAFMKDPNFLEKILPLTPELNFILGRIFEVDPVKRVTIPELKEMILSCDRLTTLPPVSQCYSPPYSPVDCARDSAYGSMESLPQLPSPVCSPVLSPAAPAFVGQNHQLIPRLSQSSNSDSDSDSESVFSDASSTSSNSSTSSFTHITNVPHCGVPQVQPHHQYVAPNPGPWYTLPSQFHRMANYFQGFQQHAPMPQLHVY
jgi:hypothetical protein